MRKNNPVSESSSSFKGLYDNKRQTEQLFVRSHHDYVTGNSVSSRSMQYEEFIVRLQILPVRKDGSACGVCS